MPSPSLSLGLFDPVCSLTPAGLARVLRERDVVAPVSPSPLQLAELLAAPEAVISQLRSLGRDDLDALDQLASGHSGEQSPLPAHAAERLLVTSDGALRPELVEVWPRVWTQMPSASEPQLGSARGLAAIDTAAMVATAEGLESMLQALEGQPMPAEASGDAEAWSKRLGRDELEPRSIMALADIAQRAGFIGVDEDHLVVTGRGHSYTLLPLRQRLLDVAGALWKQLPRWWEAAAVQLMDGQDPPEWMWPLAGAEQWRDWMERCQLVGLATNGQLTELAAALHRGSDARSVIDHALPSSTNQLYPDGPDSVIAAGVLSDEQESSLRQIARWHSGGLAARFVVTPSSVVGALQNGLSADEIRTVLAEALPGGADSPLTHLVNESMEKAQALSLYAANSESHLVVTDEMTRQLLLSDRRLGVLGLSSTDDGTLRSPLPGDQVRELLLAEGYPVLLKSAEGQLLPDGRRQQPDCAARGAGWGESDTAALIAEWDTTRQQSPERWFGGAIQRAIDAGEPLKLTVDTGQDHLTMQLELRSVGNGRLRARDIRSDVERTIPVNRIVSIAPRPVSSGQS